MRTAIRNDNIPELNKLNAVDVNKKETELWNDTLLHYAAKKGSPAIVTLLIDKGADVNAKDRYGYTPLHKAVEYSHLDTVRLLLDKGADVNAMSKTGWRPLHRVAFHDNEGMDEEENIPRETTLAIASLLIERGADLEATVDNGWTPLLLAREKDMVLLLLRNGAEWQLGLQTKPENNNYDTSIYWGWHRITLSEFRDAVEAGSKKSAQGRRIGLMAMQRRAIASRIAARDALVARVDRNANIESRTGISGFSSLEEARKLSLQRTTATNKAKANFKLPEAPKGGRRKRRATQKRRR